MRILLRLLAAIAAFVTFVSFFAATKGGTDLQLIAGGIFAIVFVLCIGFETVLDRLEAIRDRPQQSQGQR